MIKAKRSYIVEVAKGQPTEWRSYGRITLGISVGAHYHEGEKFSATMRWAQEHFNSCAIIVCDSLHRYNEPEHYSGDPAKALEKCLASGEDWLKRNLSAILSSTIPCTVTRWEDWRLHPDFNHVHRQIMGVYAQDAGMRASVEAGAQRYLRNNPVLSDCLGEARARGCSLYILEELAGLTLFARQYGLWEAYAGAKIAALEYLKSAQRADLPEPLLEIRSLKIHLKEVRLPYQPFI